MKKQLDRAKTTEVKNFQITCNLVGVDSGSFNLKIEAIGPRCSGKSTMLDQIDRFLKILGGIGFTIDEVRNKV